MAVCFGDPDHAACPMRDAKAQEAGRLPGMLHFRFVQPMLAPERADP